MSPRPHAADAAAPLPTIAETIARPVEVRAPAEAEGSTENGRHGGGEPGTATVAVVIVTWNRRAEVSKVLEALARQTYPAGRMHVVVVDNNSTDGTINLLGRKWSPDWLVENPTGEAHRPRFEAGQRAWRRGEDGLDAERNAGGFGSLTVVHNQANMGGCGGFNTGLGYVAEALAKGTGGPRGTRPDFVWLVDDDVDLPEDALEQLLRGAASDERIGLVGSRTVDIATRKATIETTIYFDRKAGGMSDNAPPGHRLHASHKEWVERVGGTRGEHEYSGLRDVDIVSACSLLARWSAVEKVGFWDWRYFIYCDDADWCLRFAKAGYRVVLNLDAVVYHTPWNMKLTVARLYYAQRNSMWMVHKVLVGSELRRAMRRQMYPILQQSFRAGWHRRLFQAGVMRRAPLDVTRNRAGKLDDDGPSPETVMECMRKAGALRRDRWMAVLCSAPGSVEWADALRGHIAASLAPGEHMPRWAYYVRNDVPDHGGHHEPTETRPDRIIYGWRWRSRLRRQLPLFNRWPRAVVVFNQFTDFPAAGGRWNIHIDAKRPTMAQLERDGVIRKLTFSLLWLGTLARCMAYAMRARPYSSATRYG